MPTDSVFIEKIGCFNFIFACLAHEFGFSSHFGFPSYGAHRQPLLTEARWQDRHGPWRRGGNSVIHASLSDMAIYLYVVWMPLFYACSLSVFFYELSRKAARLY
jgi:hypothetical protein